MDDERRSVAANAAAGAMFGVIPVVRELDENQVEAARVVGARVVEHLDLYDATRPRASSPWIPYLPPTIEPMLGYATTRDLLTEVAARMAAQNSYAARSLGRMCQDALKGLDPAVLDYRTVDQ